MNKLELVYFQISHSLQIISLKLHIANSNLIQITLCVNLQLRASVAGIYGLSNPAEIRLIWDGERLKDSDSFEDKEIENDDLIDVKVSNSRSRLEQVSSHLISCIL